MRTLIQNPDLKTLFGGASIVAAAGLLMGGIMYPNLDEREIAGPQMLLAGGGQRSEATASHTGLAAYQGRIPDYVIGTDALKPPPDLQVLAYQERSQPSTGDVTAYEAPPEVRPADWRDEPREETQYPSEHGNVVHMSDLPPPPEPPSIEDEEPFAG